LYNSIYNAPQQQPPQSHADKPTSSIENSAVESYISNVVSNDIKGEGYEGIQILLHANDIVEKKTDHRHYWLEVYLEKEQRWCSVEPFTE
jgi:hypothetical protein